MKKLSAKSRQPKRRKPIKRKASVVQRSPAEATAALRRRDYFLPHPRRLPMSLASLDALFGPALFDEPRERRR